MRQPAADRLWQDPGVFHLCLGSTLDAAQQGEADHQCQADLQGGFDVPCHDISPFANLRGLRFTSFVINSPFQVLEDATPSYLMMKGMKTWCAINWPYKLSPQQEIIPLLRIPQVCLKPALTWRKIPGGGVAWL
jgi:hypothetical protein